MNVKHQIVFFILLALNSYIQTTAFDFPTVESISNLFSEIGKTQPNKEGILKNNKKVEKDSKKYEKLKRKKRQAAEIGDESPYPYEVMSSALVPSNFI